MAISPEIKLRAFQLFDKAPVEIPLNIVAGVESTRALTGGSINIRFAPGMKPGSRDLRQMQDILQDQTVVQLCVRKTKNEPWKQLNLGYVDDKSSTVDAKGSYSWSPTIKTLDNKLREQELFIDAPEPKAQKGPNAAGAGTSDMPKQAMQKLWINFGNALQNTKSLPLLVNKIWDELVVGMMNPDSIAGSQILYGGQRLVQKGSAGNPLMQFQALKSAYTDNFISAFNAQSQNRFGGRLNMYQMLTSFASPPLYEVFFDPLEGTGFLETGSTYSVAAGSSALVFRKTPFDDYWDPAGNWTGDNSSPIPAEDVKQITLRTVPSDLYTGVHVGVTAFEQHAGNVLMYPAKWSPQLFARYGCRLMQVRVEGLAPNQTGNITSLRQTMESLRDRLFNLFLSGNSTPLRNTTAQIEAQFDYYRVGTAPGFPQMDMDYGAYGYLTSVTDRFDLKASRADSSIAMKWIDRL